MLFKDYLESLNDFAKENPESLEMKTVYAEDSGYAVVYYLPSLGNYKDRDFKSVESIKDINEDNIENGYESKEYIINSVCIH